MKIVFCHRDVLNSWISRFFMRKKKKRSALLRALEVTRGGSVVRMNEVCEAPWICVFKTVTKWRLCASKVQVRLG